MARRSSNLRPGYLLLAVMIATVLWGMAHGTSSVDRPFDVPVVFQSIPDDVVITEQSADVVNVRVLSSRAALRNVSPADMEYRIDVSGARPGPAVYEVDASRIEDQIPRGARIVSRSPAAIEVVFQRRARKSVRVRADLEGDPAVGFVVGEVSVDPPRVWLVGARGDVLRLGEVVTETIDVSGLEEPVEREARLSLGGGHVWMEQTRPVRVRIDIQPVQTPGSGSSAGEQ